MTFREEGGVPVCMYARVCKVRDGRQILNLIFPMSRFLTWAAIRNLVKKMFCLCMCLRVACAHVYACEKLGEGVGSPGAGVKGL